MGLLAKATTVATFTVALIAIIVAATTINSPQGTLFDGAVYNITWSNAPSSGTGIIGYCPASDSNNCTNINENVDLSKDSYSWTVNCPPGQYVLFINDGTGNKYSGTFNVISRGGSSSGGSTPTASGGSSSSNSTSSASATESSSSETTGNTGSTGGAAPETTTNNSPTGSSSGSTNTPAPSKSGASTLKSSLLGLFVGLGVVASVMIQLF